MLRDTFENHSRTLRIAVVALAAVVFAAGLTVSLATVPDSAAATVQVNEMSVPDASTEAESVDEVTFSFGGGTIAWSDTPEPVEEVEIVTSVEGPDGAMHESQGWTCQHTDPVDDCGFDSSTDGSLYFDVVEVYLMGDGGWTSDDFAPEPGGEVSHTVDVMVEVDVGWEGGSTTETATDSTTITVTHPDDETADTSQESVDTDVSIDLGTADVHPES